MPSGEPFGLVMIEAMKTGTAVDDDIGHRAARPGDDRVPHATTCAPAASNCGRAPRSRSIPSFRSGVNAAMNG
jgi:hypothetical protein